MNHSNSDNEDTREGNGQIGGGYKDVSQNVYCAKSDKLQTIRTKAEALRRQVEQLLAVRLLSSTGTQTGEESASPPGTNASKMRSEAQEKGDGRAGFKPE